MSSPAFQAAFVKLVADPEFRAAVRNGHLPDGLVDATERAHLAQLAAQPGIAAMRVVYRGFRLNKVLAMLPMTGRLLGDRALHDALELYWRDTPSGSFYYFEEAGRFCDHLWDRIESGDLDVPLLRDVLLFEQASIRLRHAAGEGKELLIQVEFEHHPSFLEALAQGRPLPPSVPPSTTAALGAARPTGDVEWYVLDEDHPLRLAVTTDQKDACLSH
jgi:hypothetical protein